MNVNRLLLKVFTLMVFMILSTLMFAQEKINKYGMQSQSMNKLFYKVKIVTKTNEKMIGFLTELSDSTIVISDSKFIAVNEKTTKTHKYKLVELKKIILSYPDKILNHTALNLGLFLIVPPIIDKVTVRPNDFLGFGFLTIVIWVFSVPAVALISGIITSKNQISSRNMDENRLKKMNLFIEKNFAKKKQKFKN